MKERPILFSGPMIRAILAGTKTQTRRVVTPQPQPFVQYTPDQHTQRHAEPYIDAYCSQPKTEANPRGMSTDWCWWTRDNRQSDSIARCPFGVPGDRLWVREAFSSPEDDIVAYRANGEAGAWMGDGGGGRVWIHHGWIHGATDGNQPGKWCGLGKYGGRWRPSIFMPRWASRITLEVTSVRVERLQEITEADILAEGVTVPLVAQMTGVSWSDMPTLHDAWREGWDHINGKRAPWASNPWVWVVSFRKT